MLMDPKGDTLKLQKRLRLNFDKKFKEAIECLNDHKVAGIVSYL